jgi:CheY-like chemotaxis protein
MAQMPRILVVEDNLMHYSVIRITLEMHGFNNLECVHDGQNALATVEQNPPDLILLDLDLPVITGYQVAANIRGNPYLRHIPIFAVTSSINDQVRYQALEAGCDEFIPKPYLRHQLIPLIERYLFDD